MDDKASLSIFEGQLALLRDALLALESLAPITLKKLRPLKQNT
jgi:hypothetical protein